MPGVHSLLHGHIDGKRSMDKCTTLLAEFSVQQMCLNHYVNCLLYRLLSGILLDSSKQAGSHFEVERYRWNTSEYSFEQPYRCCPSIPSKIVSNI